MAYRRDIDLEFLANVKPVDIMPLAEILTKGFNQNLDTRDPNDPVYWTYVAEQIQLYGGDTVVNILRLGKGVYYREILNDVCQKCNVKYDKTDITANIEKKFLNKLFKDTWDKMNIDEKRAILANAKIPLTPNLLGANGGFIVSSMLYAGSQFSYFLMRDFVYSIIVSIIGKTSLTFIASRTITIWAGPIGMLVSGIWAFSGPAYRVTVPACAAVAMLRKQAGLTPEEIIKQKKRNEREKEIEDALRALVDEHNKLIYLYVFCYKILELKKIIEMYDDILKIQIFGQTSILEKNKNLINKLIKMESFSSIIKENLHHGNSKDNLKNLLDYWLELIEQAPGDPTSLGYTSTPNQVIIDEFNKLISE